MSMDEYRVAMTQYGKKFTRVIEKLIELETQRAHILRFTKKETRLNEEKKQVITLIKELQKDYLRKGNVETRVYELKLESYHKRIGDIDEKLATLEAEKAAKKVKSLSLGAKNE